MDKHKHTQVARAQMSLLALSHMKPPPWVSLSHTQSGTGRVGADMADAVINTETQKHVLTLL